MATEPKPEWRDGAWWCDEASCNHRETVTHGPAVAQCRDYVFCTPAVRRLVGAARGAVAWDIDKDNAFYDRLVAALPPEGERNG